jgi:hypothetical protein
LDDRAANHFSRARFLHLDFSHLSKPSEPLCLTPGYLPKWTPLAADAGLAWVRLVVQHFAGGRRLGSFGNLTGGGKAAG